MPFRAKTNTKEATRKGRFFCAIYINHLTTIIMTVYSYLLKKKKAEN